MNLTDILSGIYGDFNRNDSKCYPQANFMEINNVHIKRLIRTSQLPRYEAFFLNTWYWKF